ncbi:DNA polymerase III [Candidatus Desantisbacteria bacterium CG07_land_8_20_14_0_80_39_15]|uniref:DNA polymerase beta n=1 Tax=Candidatus Desantisbacteria bacterium CG07_land_8_20_14_0_80_39_15 TaxID=1974549 RepID=A0A2M6ZEA8_9BACT|nr:MAG: DNA polymerase III [Candidatus Desantisbacteria bacterium CG07_land_8_20_14_0_80_39_15]
MENLEIAKIFWEIAELLEINNENPFKVRAYYKVAQVIEGLSESLNTIAERGELKKIPGVGEGTAEKISELLRTGKLKYYEELKKKIPEGLLTLLEISEIGPKTAQLLYQKLGIDNLEKLKKTLDEHKIRDLPGMGEKSEDNIRRGLELLKESGARMLLGNAFPIAEEIIEQLKKDSPVEKIEATGSLRRMKETIGDIDILVVSKNAEKVMDVFTKLKIVRDVLAKGYTKSSILTGGGIQVDVRVVKPDEFGAALHYFTGSKAHNIAVRELGVRKGLKINEYGIFKGKKKVGGEKEEDIFDAIGLPYIPPELRENYLEIESAKEGSLPELVGYDEIRGDLHIHSKWSDGEDSIEDIASAAKATGYEYVGICDHSQSLKFAGGLTIVNLRKKIEEIEKLNKKIKGITILAGAEVDIKADGTLDYPDEILKELDIVIAAVHSGFKMDQEKMTRRIIKGIENKYVHILAHPLGRLINKRDPYKVDVEHLIKTAAETKVMLEINAHPERLDLPDIYCRRAKDQGITIVIDTDAHHIDQMGFMKFGIGVARRGWLEKKDVLNTLPLDALLKKLKERR